MAQQTYYADSFQPDFGLPWTPPPTDAELALMTDDQLRGVVQARQMIEKGQSENIVGWGWTLPAWQTVMSLWRKYNVIIMLGGNQASKTTLGARLCVWVSNEVPGAEVYAFHVNERRSIDDQQRFIWENLPARLKNLPTKKGIAHSLAYTQKNGFTDGIAIMPPAKGMTRGGSIKFYSYLQFAQNQQLIEGIKAHFVWADEQMPLDLFETIRMGRLGTHHGRLLNTFTCVDGWNPTIEKIMARTRTLETRYCSHPKIRRNLPIVRESLSVGSCVIVNCWTEDNPFVDINEFWKLYGGEPAEVILARAYGEPTKSTSSAFPMFNKEYAENNGNVVKHEDLPWLKPRPNGKGGELPPYPRTNYMSIDPGGSKNWFMLWVAVDAGGTWWVYREWPDISFGEWAFSGDKNGPAVASLGYGIRDYVELVKKLEDGEEVYERFIDPRMGAAERQSKEGATTIISELDDEGLIVIPAPAAASESNKGEIEDGIQLINNLLAYKTDKPRDATNSPKMFVSDRCQNFIYAMSEYTAKLGTTEATKDPCDCLRMLRKGNCEYVPPQTRADSGSAGVY